MIEYKIDTASIDEIILHLKACDAYFTTPLSSRVDIEEYAHKMYQYATKFEAWHQDNLVGLIAAYKNEEFKTAFITNVSVLPTYMGQGLSSSLLSNCVRYFESKQFASIELEVNKENSKAMGLYAKFNFKAIKENEDAYFMKFTFAQ
ncbi:MAG: GNAT family N-acetyltransferase [Chitinophagaceae bacterium]|nr:GNAT family N-acetyltransferase [Chitinophagaceae bacterium]